MRNQGQLIIAILIIVVGLAFLIGNLLDVNVWAFVWPLALIALGIWILLRPQFVSPDTAVRQKLLGDIRRKGVWQVMDEEFWLGIGDIKLDMTDADIPLGETRLRFFGFISDVDVRVPEGVGVSASSTALVSEVKVLGRKRDSFLVPIHVVSDDYETAERKLRLEATFFIADLGIKQA